MAGNILVTGGAGYVGTHVVYELLTAGYTPVMLDCREEALKDAGQRLKELSGSSVKAACADLLDKDGMRKVFEKETISHVIHLAGLKAVRQSHGSPLAFYSVNVFGTINLLEVMSEFGVYSIIFSSSSKVYDMPRYLPLDESHPVGQCTNPYGRTKFMIEQILQDVANADKRWKVTVLRFFNPSGAHTSGLLGEDRSQPPMNILPIICHVALGKRQNLTIFGNDYKTHDGTVVKAYTHVVDVARGHVAALNHWHKLGNFKVYNLGSDNICSILELVHIFEKVSGRKVPVQYSEPQPGEKPECSADSSKAYQDLGWKPERNLQQICEDMWRWVTFGGQDTDLWGVALRNGRTSQIMIMCTPCPASIANLNTPRDEQICESLSFLSWL